MLTVQTHKTRFYIWSVIGGFLIGLTSTTCMFYFRLWKWSDVQETVNSPLGDAVSSSNSWLIFVFILCFYNDQIIPNWTKLGLLEDIAYCCWEKKDNSYLFVTPKEKFPNFFFQRLKTIQNWQKQRWHANQIKKKWNQYKIVYRRVLCIDYISDNLCNLVRNVMNLISNVCKT